VNSFLPGVPTFLFKHFEGLAQLLHGLRDRVAIDGGVQNRNHNISSSEVKQ
jgi:hypothetical protein